MWLLLLGAALAGVPEELSRAADGSLTETQRMEAFNRLVMGFSNNRPELEQIARDDDAEARERWIAVRVMGQSGAPQAREPLEALARDPMPAIRSAAASALGDLGYKSSAPVLAELLNDPAIIVRSAAAVSLGQLRDERSAEALVRALSHPSNFYRGSSLWVRHQYVEALGEIGLASSVPTLVGCLDDRDELVVTAAMEALARIAGFDFAEGRSRDEQIAAWRRWAASQKP